MIHVVDKALESFLRRAVPLTDETVDISFAAPDRTWGAALTRPTTNVFLWEINRNPGVLRTGLEQRANADGRVERRPATPIVDLHYLVTAWATEIEDEHRLLGSVLACVLGHSHLGEEDLPDALAGHRCNLALAPPDTHVPGEFWSALDGRLKPGIQLVLSLPFDVFTWSATATPAESVGAGLGRMPPRPPARAGTGPNVGPVVSLSRRRINGTLVMEGRAPIPPGAADDEAAPEGAETAAGTDSASDRKEGAGDSVRRGRAKKGRSGPTDRD